MMWSDIFFRIGSGDGETEAIEELEEKLLWYGSEATEGKIPSKHCYNDIA